ncbi:MAG: hypothetical protein WA709_33540 [Stellaceae bacterium]
MGRIWLLAMAFFGFVTVAVAAEEERAKQPSAPAVPPASGSSSPELSRSGGVITPPIGVDPQMKQTPPPSGDSMPVIPPPGTPGGNPAEQGEKLAIRNMQFHPCERDEAAEGLGDVVDDDVGHLSLCSSVGDAPQRRGRMAPDH